MPDPNSPFTSMVITFFTGTDDKDKDTRLEIFIIQPLPDGKPALAYYDDARDDYIGSGPPKSFTVPPIAGGGFLLSALTNKIIKINIDPVGKDTWRFQFSAILYFADGSQATVPKTLDLVLDQDTKFLYYPLAGITAS